MARRAVQPECSEVLTEQQEQAIVLLLAGKTQREAAAEVGIAEGLLSQWASTDALFVATLNGRRRELWQVQAERLRGLAGKAVDTIAGIMEEGADDRVRLSAAMAVLKAAALVQSEPPATDATTPEDAEIALLAAKKDRMMRHLVVLP